MDSSTSLVPVSNADSVADHSVTTKPGSNGPEPCPVCGQSGAHLWLQAPDRLHGRQKKYTLMNALPGLFARLA